MNRPNITADMKVIRNAVDAFAEVVNNAVNAILDEHRLFGIENPDLDEAEFENLTNFVTDLITHGKSDVEF